MLRQVWQLWWVKLRVFSLPPKPTWLLADGWGWAVRGEKISAHRKSSFCCALPSSFDESNFGNGGIYGFFGGILKVILKKIKINKLMDLTAEKRKSN